MAQIQINAIVPDDRSAYVFLQTNLDYFIDDFSKNSLRLSIPGTEYHIVMTGKGFSQKQGELTGGTIKTISYNDDLGNVWMEATAFSVNVGKKFDINNQYGVFAEIVDKNDVVVGSEDPDKIFSFAGRDTINALGGDDSILAGSGISTITGGLGSDIFAFLGTSTGSKMIVTDFDADGEGLNQDYLWFDDTEYRAFVSGANTKFILDGGAIVILKGVDRGDITLDDFQEPPPLL